MNLFVPDATVSMHNCTFDHDGRCFVASNTQENWFIARNRCLPEGDLTSLDFIANVSDLHSLNQMTKYWIGLRKSRWIWEGSRMSKQILIH